MAEVRLENITKSFGSTHVLKGVSLRAPDHQLTVFVGPSGCGKSTLLRIVAGLEEATSGEVWIGGQRVDGRPPAERGLAMVFQNYALYPHLSVRENIIFGLANLKLPKDEIAARVSQMAEMLDLAHLLDRKPKELSGGQRQRVAIARALAKKPKVCLLDEPLSNLDAALRLRTRVRIAELRQKTGTTMIYVTHDQVEAMTLADQIVVLRDGKVEQVGGAVELYERPANRFVAGFLGSPAMNFLSGGVTSVSDQGIELKLDGGQVVRLPAVSGPARAGDRIEIGVRPERLRPGSGATGPGTGLQLKGRIEAVEHLGDHRLIHARVPREDGKKPVLWTIKAEPSVPAQPGDEVPLGFGPRDAYLFSAEGATIPARGDARA